MAKIRITRDTYLKESSEQSSTLAPQQKTSVAAGTILDTNNYKFSNKHLILNLKSSYNGRTRWFLYQNHCEILELPNQINLDVPHLSQRDNRYRPSGTCNVTSVAMVLKYFGVKARTGERQFEDELYLEVSRWGRRHVHAHLSKLMNIYGIKNRFSTETSWDAVKRHLAEGNPVIVSGQFTSYGHIIVLRGYDERGFWVNDPWGEHFNGSGYGYYKATSGENLHYSYRKMNRASYGGKWSTWAHLPSR